MKWEGSEDLGAKECHNTEYESDIFIKDKQKEEMLDSERLIRVSIFQTKETSPGIQVVKRGKQR